MPVKRKRLACYVFKAACKRAKQLPTLWRQQCWELLCACWQWCANGTSLEPAVHRGKNATHKFLQSIRNERAWPQQCWKSCANGFNINCCATLTQKKRWEWLAEKFDRFQTLRNNTQQHPTTCNRVCKPTHRTMLRPFARGLSLRYGGYTFHNAK